MDPYRLAAPLLRALDPETAHRLTLKALRTGLVPRRRERDDPVLNIHVLGRDFPNPVGLAAGFDKNAEVADAALGLGFGFVEVGTVTPRPQAGNPRPRLFRLPGDGAVINRLGFNNAGLEAMAARLAARPRVGLVGANIGRNRETDDVVADYVAGLRALHDRADYLVVNVSSPNTPGLRALQARDSLDELLAALLAARAEVTPEDATPVPLLVKIAPDLEPGEREAIAEVALARGLDGLVIGNTTIGGREGLRGRHRGEAVAGEAGGQLGLEADNQA